MQSIRKMSYGASEGSQEQGQHPNLQPRSACKEAAQTKRTLLSHRGCSLRLRSKVPPYQEHRSSERTEHQSTYFCSNAVIYPKMRHSSFLLRKCHKC